MISSDAIHEELVALAWSLWSELGTSAWGHAHARWFVDPEPLVLFTGWLGDADARLRDAAEAWRSSLGDLPAWSGKARRRMSSGTSSLSQPCGGNSRQSSRTSGRVGRTFFPCSRTPVMPSFEAQGSRLAYVVSKAKRSSTTSTRER